MDEIKKAGLKAELMSAKALVSASTSIASVLNQATFPVAGPIVTIHSLPSAAQAFKVQSEAMAKILSMLEKIMDEI